MRTALAATILTVAIAPRVASQEPPVPFAYEAVSVAPNVHAFIEKQLNVIVSGNIVAVIGNDAVLVFDSGHHPTITRTIIGDIRRLTSKPVRYVVNSHWHDDHWAANSEFAKAYPGVEFIGTKATADLILTRQPTFGGAPCNQQLDEQSKPAREQVASGKRADGSAIPPAVMQRLALFVAGYDAHHKDCDAMVWRGVDRHVDSLMRIDLGRKTVELRFLGRGNTAGDLVAYIPDSRTILVGDLVVHPFPFATQSYITEWANVLRKIEGMEITTLVPGHGPVMHDLNYERDVRELLEAIATRSRAVYEPGMSADTLRKKVDVSDFRERFARGDRFIGANFNAQMQSAMERMWQELSNRWKPEGLDSK